MELSNRRLVESLNSRIVEQWNGGVVESSYLRIGEWWNVELVELSNCRPGYFHGYIFLLFIIFYVTFSYAGNK